MTQDLQVSKAQLEHVNLSLQNSNLELERRRAYIETVLDNIGSGVISVYSESRLMTVNRSAERILILNAEDIRSVSLSDVFKPLRLVMFTDLVERLRAGMRQTVAWGR